MPNWLTAQPSSSQIKNSHIFDFASVVFGLILHNIKSGFLLLTKHFLHRFRTSYVHGSVTSSSRYKLQQSLTSDSSNTARTFEPGQGWAKGCYDLLCFSWNALLQYSPYENTFITDIYAMKGSLKNLPPSWTPFWGHMWTTAIQKTWNVFWLEMLKILSASLDFVVCPVAQHV